MYIDAVQQGSADLAEIVLDLAGGATAFACGIAIEPALTRVHSCYEHETGGEAQRHGRACDAQRTILQRLAEHFENVARELRELIEEEYPVVGQARFTGPWHARAAAD